MSNIRLHSELGASKSERWWNCPGSVNAERGVFAPTSEYAIVGTAAHDLAERCLRDNVSPFTLVGMTIPVTVEVREGEYEVRQIEVDEEMAEAVNVYVEYCRGAIVYNEFQQSTAEFFIEQQFDLAELNPPVPMFGTADFVVWLPEKRLLEVVDLKYGTGVVVEAEKNKQFMQYALGAVLALRKRPNIIKVTVVQPRAPHPDGVIRSYEFGWQELLDYKRELMERAHATQAPDAPRVVGEWCRFCKVAATCPAMREHAVAIAQSEFDVAPEELALTSPDKLDDEQISRILAAAGVIEDWFNAVRRYVSEKLEQGVDFPGWKLVPKRATRKWKDEAQAERVLSVIQGVTEDDLYKKKFISPAQAEQLLRAKKVRYDLTPYIIKQSSGTNLVPASDPRPAALPSAQLEFSVEPVAEEPATLKAPASRGKSRKRQSTT